MEIDLERGQAALDYAQGGGRRRIGLGFLENGQVARMLMDSGRFMIYRRDSLPVHYFAYPFFCLSPFFFFFPSFFFGDGFIKRVV